MNRLSELALLCALMSSTQLRAEKLQFVLEKKIQLPYAIVDFSFDEAGDVIVVCERGGVVKVVSAKSWKELRSLKFKADRAFFSSRDKLLICSSFNKPPITVYDDAAQLKVKSKIQGDAAFRFDSTSGILGCWTMQTVCIYDMTENAKLLAEIHLHGEPQFPPEIFGISDQGVIAFDSLKFRKLAIVSAKTPKKIVEFDLPFTIHSVSFSPTGRFIAAGYYKAGKAVILDSTNGMCFEIEDEDSNYFQQMGFIDDFHLLTLTIDGTLACWDLRKKAVTQKEKVHSDTPIGFVPIGNRAFFLSCDSAGEIKKWKITKAP